MSGPETASDDWRHANLGRLLNNALRRFESRVLDLMTASGYTLLRLSHIGLTRNLDIAGTRITELARRAGMTKQAMSELAQQCEKAGLTARVDDPRDGRAQLIVFTADGLAWLGGFRAAVQQAEREMRDELGDGPVDQMVDMLRRYGREFDPLTRPAI